MIRIMLKISVICPNRDNEGKSGDEHKRPAVQSKIGGVSSLGEASFFGCVTIPDSEF